MKDNTTDTTKSNDALQEIHDFYHKKPKNFGLNHQITGKNKLVGIILFYPVLYFILIWFVSIVVSPSSDFWAAINILVFVTILLLAIQKYNQL